MSVDRRGSTTRTLVKQPTGGLVDGLDLDAVDNALDRGDLEAVRLLLGVSRPAWRLLLDQL